MQVIHDWSRTPAVAGQDLFTAINLARETQREDHAEWLSAFTTAVKCWWTDETARLALFARARGLLLWKGQPHVLESDRLFNAELEVEQTEDSLMKTKLEALVRIETAAIHPLRPQGTFADSFELTMTRVRAEIIANLSGSAAIGMVN